MKQNTVKSVIGRVMYSVYVDCPHCEKTLDLNDCNAGFIRYPYSDDSSEYAHAEDVLGMAVSGSKTVPAKWEGLKIEYTCCYCDGVFVLSELET